MCGATAIEIGTANFLDPYNIEIKYRYEDNESALSYYEVPSTLEDANILAHILKYCCLEAYDNTVGIDFTRKKLDYEKKQKEASKDVADGKLAPDFTLKSIDGTDLSLSSLRGKYVILDFWGSWCGWCIKGFPEMKKYYQKYSDRLEILGVDCNDTEEKWKAAVEKHELKWKHVFNPQDSDLPARYAVSGYPTKIIIDPDGKIVKTVAGEDPAFYNFLDELFK